jgi:HD superfamily phosphohydrolase
MAEKFKRTIFDSIHGFIPLTQTEDRIMNSLYFQRLRWIKQLGWSHYIFPGATHTRFAHALGVSYVMDKIVKSIGKGVDDKRLYNSKIRDAETMFHRKMRLAAMLHDIGTFPFSHSVEQGYISHNKRQMSEGGAKNSPANHEELGSYIINNTCFEGGITRILKDDGFDPREISNIIQGKSDHWLANQLMHSDIDADRIDYLLRDAHHTGAKYGVFDMDYLISNMRAVKSGGNEILVINEGAVTVVEYFLISRYSWYTQIINEGTAYKFDMLAARIAEFFIESGTIYSFDELKNMAKTNPRAFFGFTDSYFTVKLQQALETGLPTVVPNTSSKRASILSRQVSQMIEMLMFRIPLTQIKTLPFESSLIKSPDDRAARIERIHAAVEWLAEKLQAIPSGWIIEDIPKRDIIFTKSHSSIKKNAKDKLMGPESARIISRDQKVRLLVDVPNALVGILSEYQNFIPRVYVSQATFRYLQSKGLLDEMKSLFALPSTASSASTASTPSSASTGPSAPFKSPRKKSA